MTACSTPSATTPHLQVCKTNDPESPLTSKRLSDDDLAELAKAGDRAAFAELIERYHRFGIAKANVILRNHDDAEDVVQSVWVQVWMRFELYRSQGTFGAWLSRIITNQCLMRLRNSRAAKTTSVDEVFG